MHVLRLMFVCPVVGQLHQQHCSTVPQHLLWRASVQHVVSVCLLPLHSMTTHWLQLWLLYKICTRSVVCDSETTMMILRLGCYIKARGATKIENPGDNDEVCFWCASFGMFKSHVSNYVCNYQPSHRIKTLWHCQLTTSTLKLEKRQTDRQTDGWCMLLYTFCYGCSQHNNWRFVCTELGLTLYSNCEVQSLEHYLQQYL